MAKNTTVFFTKAARINGTRFTQGIDAYNTYKIFFTGGTDGSIIEAIPITTTDTVANAILLAIYDGTTYREVGHISVPASSGRGTVNAVSGMNRGNLPWLQVDANGNPVIKMESGYFLAAKLNVNYTTASSYFEITGIGGDF